VLARGDTAGLGNRAQAAGILREAAGALALDAIYSRWMRSLLSPHGVYSPDDVDGALARVFGAGVRPLRIEQALFDAMLSGWRSQQTARYLRAKTIQANETAVRAFCEYAQCWPWQWRTLHVDEYFEDLLSRPPRLARSTLRAYQQRLRGFSDYACDRRYPWSVICEREFGRGPGQLFDDRNRVAHLDEFEGDPRRRPLTIDELEAAVRRDPR